MTFDEAAISHEIAELRGPLNGERQELVDEILAQDPPALPSARFPTASVRIRE